MRFNYRSQMSQLTDTLLKSRSIKAARADSQHRPSVLWRAFLQGCGQRQAFSARLLTLCLTLATSATDGITKSPEAAQYNPDATCKVVE